MKRICLIVIGLLLTLHFAQAQDESQPPDGALFTYMSENHDFEIFFPRTEWLPDSQSFVLQTVTRDYGFSVTPLLQYFIPTNTLRSLARISNSISPNGHYSIYGRSEQVCGEGACSAVTALIDLETGVQVNLLKPAAIRSFIRWSADSSALLFMDDGPYGGLGGIFYVSVAQAFAAEGDFQAQMLMNYSIDLPSFVDISRDGRRVLVQAFLDFPRSQGLYLWDAPVPPTRSSDTQFLAPVDGQLILRDEIVAGASFIPGDDQHLLVVLNRGIAKYDVETHEITVIDPHINTKWVTWAYFSPDVRYVLTYQKLIENRDWQRSQIALYPVGSY